MRGRGSGRIINLSSIVGQRGASVNGVHYAASKAGICDHPLRGDRAGAARRDRERARAGGDGPSVAAVPADKVEAMVKTIPVGSLGRPEEIASLVAWLASDDAGFVTGATYDINGGMLMR